MWFCESVSEGMKIKEVIFNFLPSWWYRNYGIEYGERMIFNPDYRVEAYLNMRRFFYERFGREMGGGCGEPKPTVIAPAFDTSIVQALVGLNVRYPKEQYPAGSGELAAKEIMKLSLPEDLWSVFPFSCVKEQVKYLNDKLGMDVPALFVPRGVLNDAIQICGTGFYGDLIDEECEYRDIALNFTSSLIKRQLLENKKVFGRTDFYMLNCTAAIAGAKTYEEVVFPYDYELFNFCMKNNIGFKLHHCGNFDSFTKIYSKMNSTLFVEIGHESKVRPVMEEFPDTKVQYLFDSAFLQRASASQIRDRAGELLEEAGQYGRRFSVAVSDIEYGTPDDNLFELINMFKS